MNIWSSIFKRWGMGTLSNPDKGYQNAAQHRNSTATGISVTDERSLQISAVWACVQLIANSVASLPLGFYEKTPTGRKPLDKHYLKDLFLKSPNALMKPRDFRLCMTVQMCLWHNAYSEIIWNGERPVALMPLRPGRMTPFITTDGELTYHYAVESGVKIYAKRSILHLKGFSTDGIVGCERSEYARETFGLSVSAETFAAKQFANGGRPGGVISFDAFLNEAQRSQAKMLYEGISEGAIHANELWILEGGTKYEPLDFNADQMQMLATRMMQLSEVARFFGVPEVMIGAGGNATSAWPASFEQQVLYFLNFTLQGYIDEWECAITESLIPVRDQGNIFADHDVSEFIKMDSNTKANVLSRLTQNGLMTRNEGRHKLGLPRMDGADELTVQTNLSNIEDLEVINDDSQAEQPARQMPVEVRQ